MIIKDIDKFIFSPSTKIKKIVYELYKRKTSICLICKNDRSLLGIITLSDIKKSILSGIDPDSPVNGIMNKDYISARDNDISHILKKKSTVISYGEKYFVKVPILNKFGRVVAIYINEGESDQPKTVLITGGAGYVGSILCRKLIKKNYKVFVLDKLLFGNHSIKDLIKKSDQFKLIKGSVNNLCDLMEGIRQSDSVIHLAGIVGDPASQINPINTLEDNHFSTLSLIELSKYYQVSRFIFASSCSVYGSNRKFLQETDNFNPLSLYARSKVLTERKLLEMTDKYFNPITLRFGTIYGVSPRMRFDLVVNTMVAEAYYKKEITIKGGSQWRPLLHVSDAAEACIMALEAPIDKVRGQVFNVGSVENNFIIEEIAYRIKRYLPKTKISISQEPGDKRNYKVSFRKIKKTLGFSAKQTLDGGIKEIISSMKKGKFRDYKNHKYNNYLTSINGNYRSSE